MLIRLDTAVATAQLEAPNAPARDALAVARSWMRHQRRAALGHNSGVVVHVAVPGGRWHRIGCIGNHTL